MKTHLECLPCLSRNAVVIAKKSTDDPAVRLRIVRESMKMLTESDMQEAPPFYAAKIMDIAFQLTSGARTDPYREEKDKSIALANRLLKELGSIPEYDPGSFESRLRLAIAGNILDFGIFSDLDLGEALHIIRKAFTAPIDREAMLKQQKRIGSARKILYILDNCGEGAFDRVFMELFKDKVTVGVRGRNSLNDVTRRELAESGYGPDIPIVDNGSNIPGTMTGYLPEPFLNAMKSADLIIAKGQGNYETMDEIPYPASFLFLSKCEVVCGRLNAEPKSIQIRNINF